MFEETDSNDVKLIDFSLALTQEQLDEKKGQRDPVLEHFMKLPPYFIPPEMFSMKKNYHQSCDMWSLGCLIYNLVTGIPPFMEEDIDKQKIVTQLGEYTGQCKMFDKYASESL